MANMIELKHISKTYRLKGKAVPALKDISLQLAQGSIFGVIGPSGAGKSTLIRCVNLLEQPDTGDVIIDGHNLTAMSPKALRDARKQIGMIFQHFNLLSSRTVYQNIALPLQLSGMDSDSIKPRVNNLINLTGLSEKADQYPNQLSGGQKQRVAIARALANEPKVLLCDEATSSLDPETTHSILQLLKKINRALNITILLITHEMDVVKEICQRLAIIEDGRIIEEAKVLEFFSNPKTDTAKRFIRSSIEHKLPEAIQERITDKPTPESNPLWRIAFLGQAASEPLISKVIQHYQVDLNILLGNLELIGDETFGTMLVEASGSQEQLQKGFTFLKSKGIHIETIGYVCK